MIIAFISLSEDNHKLIKNLNQAKCPVQIFDRRNLMYDDKLQAAAHIISRNQPFTEPAIIPLVICLLRIIYTISVGRALKVITAN